MDKCVAAWEEFGAALAGMNAWIAAFQERVEREGKQSDGKSTEDVGRRRDLLRDLIQ